MQDRKGSVQIMVCTRCSLERVMELGARQQAATAKALSLSLSLAVGRYPGTTAGPRAVTLPRTGC